MRARRESGASWPSKGPADEPALKPALKPAPPRPAPPRLRLRLVRVPLRWPGAVEAPVSDACDYLLSIAPPLPPPAWDRHSARQPSSACRVCAEELVPAGKPGVFLKVWEEQIYWLSV